MGSIVIKDNQKFSEAEECLDRIKKFINDESNNSIESYKQSIEELERFLPQLKEKQLLIQGYKKLIDLYTKLATKIFTQKTEFLEKANNYFQKIIELEQGDSLSCNELTKEIVKETQFIKNPDPIRIELPKAEFRSIKTTKELAMLLIDLPKSSMQYSDLTNLALVVIEEFSHKYVKTREFINEVEILSIVNNLEIIKALLSQFINAIERDVLLDPNVLNGLAQILCNSNPELLDPDDLTKILKVINERLDNLHQKGSEDKLLSLIKSIAKVLVAMADANVKGLSRTEQHDPLYDSLSKLISSFDVVEFFLEQKPNFHVRQFALYARQALVRIPNDETKLQSAIRRIIKIGKGVNALNSAFQQKSPSELLGAFKEFKEAFKCKVSQKEWFDNLRYAEMLIASNNFTIFEKFIKENSNCYMQESMFYGIISLLKQTIEDHFDINVRCCAVKLLSQLWQAYVKLRNNMEDVIAIKDYCNEYLTLQDGGYIGKHEDIHRWISEIFLNRTKFDPRYELEIVFQEEVEKLKSILSEYPKESLSNHCFHEIAKRSDSDQQLTLLEEAKWKKELQDKIKNISYRMSEEYVRDIVVDKISKLKNKVLSNKYIMDELKLYVDILAATKMDYEAKQPFDLTKRIEQWLKLDDKDKVFLLSGDAGIGKTIFNRHLEVILWKKCESNNFVPSVLPFFVPLGSLERVEDNFIEEYFQKYLDREFDSGFNKKDIDILKRDYKVIFILDGYDEIKLQTNLYEKYFKQWNAKIIISCRSDYLIKNKNYIEMFAPNDVCKELQNFSEAYILPFKEMQVKEYIDKYLSINFNYVNKDDIEAKIKKIPGLKELICTPFILMISIEIIPNLFEQNFANLQSSSNKITKAILLDKFINKLFEREKNKLRTGYKFYKDGWEDNLYITEDFWEFSTELAITMHKNNLNEIYYVPRLFGKNKRSHFEDFFGNSTDIYQAEKLRKVRDACGCILKTVGKNRRAFIYPGLKEYFVGRSILLEEEDKSTNNKQSTMMFTNFYANNIEVMKNLADRVLESKTLREKFLNYIEKSKNNKEYSIAAANAITALNYVNVHFYEINFEDIDITSADLNKSFFYKCDFSRANLSKVNLQGASFIRCELNKTNFSEVYFGELPYIKLEEPAKDLSLYKDLLCVIGSKKVRIYEYNNKEVLWKCIKERYPLSPHDFIKGGVLNNCILVLNDHYTLEYNDKWYDLDFGSESEHNICLADHGKIFLRKSGNKFEYIVSNPLNNELNTNILDIDSTRFVDIDNTRFELSDKINAFLKDKYIWKGTNAWKVNAIAIKNNAVAIAFQNHKIKVYFNKYVEIKGKLTLESKIFNGSKIAENVTILTWGKENLYSSGNEINKWVFDESNCHLEKILLDIPNNQIVTALAVNDDNIVACGFENGAVALNLLPRNVHEITSAFEQEAGYDFVYQSIPEDGHCLYNAVALYCGLDQQTLRNIVAGRIRNNLDAYQGLINGLEGDNGRSVNEYLIDIEVGKEWAHNLEIAVLMKILDRPIIIVESNNRIRNLSDVEDNNGLVFTGEPIFVYYNGHNHYDALICRDDINLIGIDIFNKLKKGNINIRNLRKANTTNAEVISCTSSPRPHFFQEQHKSKISSIEFSKLYPILFSSCSDDIRFWNFEGKCLYRLTINDKINKIITIENQLLSASEKGYIRFWNLHDKIIKSSEKDNGFNVSLYYYNRGFSENIDTNLTLEDKKFISKDPLYKSSKVNFYGTHMVDLENLTHLDPGYQLMLQSGAYIEEKEKWELFQACEEGNIEKLRSSNYNLQEFNLNAKKTLLETLFEITVTNNGKLDINCRLEIIRYLIEKNPSNQIMGHALWLVAKENEFAIMDILLPKYINSINTRSICGATPLHIAIERGASLDVTIEKKCVKTVELLLKYKADLNMKKGLENEDGDTSLGIAARFGNFKVAEILLKARASIDEPSQKSERTPLWNAAYNSREEIVSLLLENKADHTKYKKYDETTPLYMACQIGNDSIVNKLIESNADVDKPASGKFKGMTPIHQASRNNHLEVVKLLLKNKANLEIKTKDGKNPLFTACKEENIEIVKELIKAKADLEIKTEDGKTPLLVVCQEGNIEIVEELIRAKSDVNKCANKQYKGINFLHKFLDNNLYKNINLLYQTYINNKYENITPLYQASMSNHGKIVKLLLEYKADPDLFSDFDQTPLDIAKKKNHKEIIDLLKKKNKYGF